MKSKKVFYVMLGILGLASALVVVAAVLGDIFLHKQSNRLVSLKLDNQVIEAQESSLVQAKKDIEKYSDLEAVAKQIVPQDKDQAKATREIVNLADQAGVKIASIGFPASTLGQTAPKASSGSSTTTPAPTAAPGTETQLKAVDGIKNLYQLDITVTSNTTNPTSYARLLDFLNRLEQNRRTAQVSQITIQPDVTNRSALNFSLTITLYIKP